MYLFIIFYSTRAYEAVFGMLAACCGPIPINSCVQSGLAGFPKSIHLRVTRSIFSELRLQERCTDIKIKSVCKRDKKANEETVCRRIFASHNWCTQSWEVLYLTLHAQSMEKLRPCLEKHQKITRMERDRLNYLSPITQDRDEHDIRMPNIKILQKPQVGHLGTEVVVLDLLRTVLLGK